MKTVLFDGEASCPYCESETYEVLELDGRLATIQCLFCLRDIRKAFVRTRDHEAPEEFGQEFRFKTGRNKGKTLDEVYMTEEGKRYMEFLRDNATVEPVRVAVTEYLRAKRGEGGVGRTKNQREKNTPLPLPEKIDRVVSATVSRVAPAPIAKQESGA